MSRQLEQVWEDRNTKRAKQIVYAIEAGLEKSLGRAGAHFTGLTIKVNPGDCLAVVKVSLAGKPQVAFVGAEDLGSCLIKIVREANRDSLKWQVDKYGGQSEGDD
jgi:hypothetical protein